MLLIAYDGSDGAKAAIAGAAAVAPGSEAVVVTTWEPFLETLARSGAGFGQLVMEPSPETDAQIAEAALTVASEGAALARAAGLTARPQALSTFHGTVATILDAATEHDASAIVLGTRGLGRVKAAMLGSVSAGVLHHSTLPVMIVPS